MEAEGRALRQNVLRTGIGLVCLGAAAILLVAGAGFCLWAFYQWLIVNVGMIEAALIVGAGLLIVSGGLMWTAMRLSR